MSIWVVAPEEKKIELVYVAQDKTTYPFWIKVKHHLTVGEQRRVMTAGWRGLRNGRPDEDGVRQQEIQIDWKAQTFARTEAYLTAWSLTDDKDQSLPVTRETIESLTPDVYKLIEDAIAAHVTEADQEKKVTDGEPSPSATSV